MELNQLFRLQFSPYFNMSRSQYFIIENRFLPAPATGYFEHNLIFIIQNRFYLNPVTGFRINAFMLKITGYVPDMEKWSCNVGVC